MNKKIILLVVCVILVILLFCAIIFNKDKKSDKKSDETENNNNNNNSLVIYDKDENILYDNSKENEVTEIIRDTTIQGIVEMNHNGYIYIFNGQHFGEFGFEMEEYTRANIVDKKQICIDYITLEKYDTNYIQEGDIIICTGDLTKKGYTGSNDFDTKNNAIVVLKSNDYNKMKQDALNSNNKYPSIITIGDIYTKSGYLYLKYSLEDDTYSNTEYNFPFAVKAYITENTQITGNLQKGEIVKVQYENLSTDELKLKSIEVIED